MRIGLISDIHANLGGLRSVLGQLHGVDAIVCAGDITGYYTRPNEVMAELLEHRVTFIAGNHDLYLRQPPQKCNELLRQSIAFTRAAVSCETAERLLSLSCRAHLNFDGLRVAVFHGSPWDPQEEYVYPDSRNWARFASVDADVIILGHTHRPMLRVVGKKIVVNPGSCGQPRDGDNRAAFAVLETTSRKVAFGRVAYDVDGLAAEVRRLKLDERLVQMIGSSIPVASAVVAKKPLSRV